MGESPGDGQEEGLEGFGGRVKQRGGPDRDAHLHGRDAAPQVGDGALGDGSMEEREGGQ